MNRTTSLPPPDPFSDYQPKSPFAEAMPASPAGKAASGDASEAWGPYVHPDAGFSDLSSSGQAQSLEILITWGTSVLHIAHLSPPRAFTVGDMADSPSEKVDFHLPEGIVGRKILPLVVIEDGTPHVVVPDTASGKLHSETSEIDLRSVLGELAPSHAAPQTQQLALDGKSRVSMKLGEVELYVRLVPRSAPIQRGLLANFDWAIPSYFGTTAATMGGLMAALAYFVPPFGLSDESQIDKDRVLAINHYLDAAGEREKERPPEIQEHAGGEAEGQSAQSSPGPAGTSGKDDSPQTNKRVAVKGPTDTPQLLLSKHEALVLATEFGMVGILNSGIAADPNAPTSIFGRDATLGNDDISAHGNLWADSIGEARGTSGLSMIGPALGGNFGDGTGISISDIGNGLLGPGTGEKGWGHSRSPIQGGHTVKSPNPVRPGITEVNGRIPPQVVQRIVRQNFGRFRLCYQQGLARNPSLEGRIPVRFVIGRDGAVSNVASVADFPDAQVRSCVQNAFYGLSFPKPEGGVVTVTYPLIFSPD